MSFGELEDKIRSDIQQSLIREFKTQFELDVVVSGELDSMAFKLGWRFGI